MHTKIVFIFVCGLLPMVYTGEISSSVMEAVFTRGKVDAVLELPSIMSTVLSNPILNMMDDSLDDRTEFMTGLMKNMTFAAQSPFLATLKMFGVHEVQPFWITNKISMKGISLPVINAFRALPGDFTIREPIQVKLIKPIAGNKTISRESVEATKLQWGVKKIGADTVWASKTNGAGVIVANIDTGVFANHEALKSNYAGFWHDSIKHRAKPYDDDGHGTHTMGTICGTKNGIGVAPGAKWVACKGLGATGGTDTTLSECAQWILNLKQRPTVVCNSWGGGQGQNFFNDEIRAWQAANIVPVFAIGNDGPKCSSAGSPGDQPNLISVGATDFSDNMAKFSSRGPSKGGVMKPEVSAPGTNIVSAWPNGRYNSISGTSMATPHVTGAVALMRAANPGITFQQILAKLEDTTVRPKPTEADLKCGKVPNNRAYPNNAYGYGRINVAQAMG